MLRHGGWTPLPAPDADTDAEARRTPARHGVGGFSLDQTRPGRRHASADTCSCSDARRTPREEDGSLFTPFSRPSLFNVTILFYLIVLYYWNILFDFFFCYSNILFDFFFITQIFYLIFSFVTQIFYLIFSLLLKYFIWLVWYFFFLFFRE